jgi:hypothetical protein
LYILYKLNKMNLSFLKKKPIPIHDSKVIIDKDGIRFEKVKDNVFNIKFSILNNRVNLPNVINFSFVRLIYDLNPDVYDYVDVKISDDGNEALFLVTMKHFFKEFGLPQRYSSLQVVKMINHEQNMIEFYGKTNPSEKPLHLPKKAELLPLEHMNIQCIIVSNHEVEFRVELIFENNFTLIPMIEKLAGKILHKIFNNTKLFIQSMSPLI